MFQSSLRIEPFHGYGKSLLKKHGYSPDAYVQMAIQLATYRLWGEQAGTYAPAQVRHFLHGRTDTCRGVSIESAAFVQKMGAHPSYDNVDPETQKEKLVLLQKAVKAHGRITKLANLGQGVDSHFTALSVASKDGEKLPDLFSDPVFQRSKRWRVNSSNVSLDTWLGFGYGPVVPDGVSIAYSIHARHLDFNVAALKATGWADQLAHHLVEALVEMRELIESEPLPPATAGKV